jgi:hypothetical protein
MKLVIQGDKIAALVGDDFPTTDMLVAVPDGFDINQAHRYRYDGSQIVPRVPEKVTARQAVQALISVNKLHLVQPAIDAIADPVQRAMVQAEWDKSQDFERNRPTLIALATAIGLDAAGLDALFIAAEDL